MRLIDADKSLECFDHNTWQGDMMISIAKNIETAYDVDKVIEQLISTSYMDDSDWYSDRVIHLNDAIEIVKKGGIE